MDPIDELFEEFAADFKNFIQERLEANNYPYPFGYKRNRTPFGTGNKVASGRLISSVDVIWNAPSQQFEVSMADYWKYVNDGRRPGVGFNPSLLYEWMQKRNLNRDKSGKFKKFNRKSVAFAIMLNIKKFGIAPTNFYDDAYADFQELFVERLDELGEAITQQYQDYINNVIEKDIQS